MSNNTRQSPCTDVNMGEILKKLQINKYSSHCWGSLGLGLVLLENIEVAEPPKPEVLVRIWRRGWDISPGSPLNSQHAEIEVIWGPKFPLQTPHSAFPPPCWCFLHSFIVLHRQVLGQVCACLEYLYVWNFSSLFFFWKKQWWKNSGLVLNQALNAAQATLGAQCLISIRHLPHISHCSPGSAWKGALIADKKVWHLFCQRL